jgi:hypothetical protein
MRGDLKHSDVKIVTVKIRRLAFAAEASGNSKSDQRLARLHSVALSMKNNGR